MVRWAVREVVVVAAWRRRIGERGRIVRAQVVQPVVEGRPQLLSTSPDGIVAFGNIGFGNIAFGNIGFGNIGFGNIVIGYAVFSQVGSAGIDSTTVSHGLDVRHRHLRIQLGPLTRARRVQAERAGGTIVT